MTELLYTSDDLRGVVAVMPTPVRGARLPDGRGGTRAAHIVDFAETERMVNRLISDGVGALMTNGSLGEMATLSFSEWLLFNQKVLATAVGTRPNLPIFCGVTALSTAETIERARALHGLGARGLFLGRPFWCALSDDAILAFYEDVIGAVPDMSLVVYDNPFAFKGPIPTSVYARLSEYPQVVGSKYIALTPKYSEDMVAVSGRVRLLPIEVEWVKATALFPEAAVACWTSSAPCDPFPITVLRDAVERGDTDTADALTARIAYTYETFLAFSDFPEFSKYNIPLEKARYDAAGYIVAGPALPPHHVVPGHYLEGSREAGRRWRDLAAALRAEHSTAAA